MIVRHVWQPKDRIASSKKKSEKDGVKAIICVLLLILAPFASAAVKADRTMYFTVTPGEGIPITDKPVAYSTPGNVSTKVIVLGPEVTIVGLYLEIRTLSTEDQSTFVFPTVDDYRQQTQPPSANHVAPNVTFEAFQDQNGASKPVRLRVRALGGGMDLQYLEAKIELLFGGDEKNQANQPGTYHLRATYSPNVEGKWKGVLKTNLITIVIKDSHIQTTPTPPPAVKP